MRSSSDILVVLAGGFLMSSSYLVGRVCLRSVWRREWRSQRTLHGQDFYFQIRSPRDHRYQTASLKRHGLAGYNCFQLTSPTSIELYTCPPSQVPGQLPYSWKGLEVPNCPHTRNTHVTTTSCSSCLALQDPAPQELQKHFHNLLYTRNF